MCDGGYGSDIYTRQELIESFDLNRVTASPAQFDQVLMQSLSLSPSLTPSLAGAVCTGLDAGDFGGDKWECVGEIIEIRASHSDEISGLLF